MRSNIELQSCTLTAACATDERRKVSFFAVEPETASSAMMMMSMEMAGADKVPVSIKLRDCVVRGDASLIRASQPIEMDWTNGLAALSEPLFVGDGAMPARGGRWSLEIDHVTAHLGGGLCALSSGTQPLETKVSCHNSILICSPEVPLFRTQGDDTHTNLKGKLAWSGYQNLYEGVRTFWNVSDSSGRQPPEEMSETAWRGHWAAAASETPALRDPAAPLGWRLSPEINPKALRDRTALDYALRRDSQAADKADDGKDIGFRLDDLPKPLGADLGSSSSSSTPATSPAPPPPPGSGPPTSDAEKSP